MQEIKNFSEEALKDVFLNQGHKAFRATQTFDWLHNKRVSSWDEMTNLDKKLRESLSNEFLLNSLELKGIEDSKDQETTKFLWQLADGKLVESVLIRAPGRRTVCVSSQVGCPARCAFCASGKKGLFRNLSTSEIIEQVYRIQTYLEKEGEKVSNIVFMGMGEPLENYQNVTDAIRLLIHPKGFNLSQRRITVSTVGLVDEIKRLAEEEDFKVNLVLSLHAPSQHIRKKIIPYARKYELQDVLAAMEYYSEKTKRDITYEYTLIAGINDQKEHAQDLVKLLRHQQCTVNLIPYNPVEGLNLQRPEKEAIEEFKAVLEDHHIPTTWRYTKGKDIAAACGQLALKEQDQATSSFIGLEKFLISSKEKATQKLESLI